MTEELLRIPLFPLHAVLCPGAAMPLHIFEERYRLMIGRCIEEAEPFGIVLIREGRETGPLKGHIADVGTTAVIKEAGRYPDGRYDIMTVGGRRFRIETIAREREPYLVGNVRILPEPMGDAEAARRLAGRVSERFLRYLELLGPALEDEDGPEIEVEIEIETQDPEEPAGSAEPAASEPAGPGGSTAGEGSSQSEPIELKGDIERRELLMAAARRLASPDDPTVLSYVLSALVEVELPNRQALLEAPDTESRLRGLDALLTREIRLLERRLKPLTVDRRMAPLRRN